MYKKQKKCLVCGAVCCCDGPKINFVSGGSSGGGQQAVCVGSTGLEGPMGATGQQGQDAYEIAVDNGFTGTQEEWLASLVGPQGSNPNFGAIVPYSSVNSESTYEISESGVIRHVYFSGFTGYDLDVQFDRHVN